MSKPHVVRREALFFVRPKEGATKGAAADEIADALIAEINEDRKKKGLPPLPKE